MINIYLTKMEDAKRALKRNLSDLHLQDAFDGYLEDLVDSGCADDYEEALSETLENIICSIIAKMDAGKN